MRFFPNEFLGLTRPTNFSLHLGDCNSFNFNSFLQRIFKKLKRLENFTLTGRLKPTPAADDHDDVLDFSSSLIILSENNIRLNNVNIDFPKFRTNHMLASLKQWRLKNFSHHGKMISEKDPGAQNS